MQDVVHHRRIGERLPCARYVVPTDTAGRVETRTVADFETVASQRLNEGGFEIHEGVAGVGAVADVPLLSVVDAAKVRVGDVPEGTGQVFLPVLDTILVLVPRIFTPSRVRFTGIQHAVEVGVLLSVVKGIAVGVVVSWVAGLGRVAVGAVDFHAVVDAVAVGVRRRRIGEQGERFVGIVEAVAVGVGSLRVGGRDTVHFSGEGGTPAGADALNGITRRRGFSDNAVGAVAETGGRTAHRGPGWVHVFEEVVEPVAVRVAVGPVSVGGRGCIQPVGGFPTVRHAVAVGVPTCRVFVDVAVTVVVVGGAVCIAVVVGIGRINKPVLVIVKPVGTDVADRVLIAQNDGTGAVGAGSATSGLVELERIFLVPVVDGDGTVPPDAVVEHGGRV